MVSFALKKNRYLLHVLKAERYTIGKNYYIIIFLNCINCMNYDTVVVIRLLPRCASI